MKLKELLDSQRIGRVTGCSYRRACIERPAPADFWRLDVAQSGGGLFLDIGSHVLDLLDHLLGEFVEFGGAAQAARGARVEDTVALHFRTSNGVIGSGNWNFAADRNEEILEIQGTGGRITTQVLAHAPITLESHGATERFDIPDPPHIQQPLIQSMVNELLGRGKCPSTGATAARTSKVMDAALQSFYGGRDDEFWNRT